MRLIDADALKLCVQLEIDEARKIKASASVLVILNRFIDSINAQPIIEERKTGKWIEKIVEDCIGFNTKIWECSECGKQIHCANNFCPNCGADMRGEHNALDR